MTGQTSANSFLYDPSSSVYMREERRSAASDRTAFSQRAMQARALDPMHQLHFSSAGEERTAIETNVARTRLVPRQTITSTGTSTINGSMQADLMQMLEMPHRELFPRQTQQQQQQQRIYSNASQTMNVQLQPSSSLFTRDRPRPNTHTRPQFRTKVVCNLTCRYCHTDLCHRGMKAILLADMAVQLFSTDVPPPRAELVFDDYQTRNCYCRIRDVACKDCGNVIGYHVTQPCQPCMDACNNGHFWMFHCDHVDSSDRMTESGKPLLWAALPRPDMDVPLAAEKDVMR